MSFGRGRAWACVGLLAATAAITVDITYRGPLERLDLVLSQQWFPPPAHSAAWWFWWLLAQVGNEYVLIPPLGACCLIAAARLRSIRPIVVTFCVCATLALVIPGIKIVTGRTAPRSGYDAMFADGNEFPSGHAVNAIVIWGAALEMLVLAFPVVERWLTVRVRRVLVVVGSTAAGIGMVGLNYHWFTDALAGWLLGAMFFLVFLGLDVFAPLAARRAALRAAGHAPAVGEHT